MSFSLTKGENVNLSKQAPSLKNAVIGLGWDAVDEGATVDLDASVFLVGANGTVEEKKNFVFFNNKSSHDGSVVHQGDNLTGEGDGDDEKVNIDLSKVSPTVDKVIVTVTLHDAKSKNQDFSSIKNAFVRVVNADDSQEVARYQLTDEGGTGTAMIFGELYRDGEDWGFKAMGELVEGGTLGDIASKYGANS